MDVYSALEEFGLNNREAKVYVKLLELGSTTASQLAKYVNILRPTMYEVLNEMIKKGVVSYSFSGRKKIFQALNPKVLTQILEDKKRMLQDFVPELVNISKANTSEQKVTTFFGEKGLKAIYDDMLVTNKDIFHIFNYQEYSKLFKLYWIQNFIQKRVEKKIWFRAVVNKITDPELKKSSKKQLREIKSLNFLKDFKMSMFIYGDKCGFFTFNEQPVGILIENPLISSSLKVLFNNLYS